MPQVYSCSHVDRFVDRWCGEHRKGHRVGERFGHHLLDLIQQGLGRHPAAFGDHTQDAGVLRQPGILIGCEHQRASNARDSEPIDLVVLPGDRAIQHPQGLRRLDLALSDRHTRRTAGCCQLVCDAHANRVAKAVLKCTRDHLDRFGFNVSICPTAGLVGHGDRPGRDQTVGPIAKGHRCSIVLIDRNREVSIRWTAFEEVRHLVPCALRCCDPTVEACVQERREGQHEGLIGKPGRLENFVLPFAVLNRDQDLRRIRQRRDECCGQQLKQNRVRDFLSPNDLACVDGNRASRDRSQAELDIDRRSGCAWQFESDQLRQRDDRSTLRRCHNSRLLRLVVLIVRPHIAHESEKLLEHVTEIQDVEVGPVWINAADQLLQPIVDRIEILVRVIDTRWDQRCHNVTSVVSGPKRTRLLGVFRSTKIHRILTTALLSSLIRSGLIAVTSRISTRGSCRPIALWT